MHYIKPMLKCGFRLHVVEQDRKHNDRSTAKCLMSRIIKIQSNFF